MSLILDALKKADESRPDDTGATITQPELPPSYTPQPTQIPWVGASAVVVAGLIIIVAAWYFLSLDTNIEHAKTTATAPMVTAQERTVPTAVPAVTAQKPIKNFAPEQNTSSTQNRRDEKIEALYRQPSTDKPKSEIDSLYSSATPTPQSETAQTEIRRPAEDKPTLETKSAPTQTASPTIADTDVERLEDYLSVINIRDLPSNIQNEIPTLIYTDHIYANSHLDIIMINKMPLRNGDISPKGIRVEKIVEDGAILVYRGQRFSMYALNSWVNL